MVMRYFIENRGDGINRLDGSSNQHSEITEFRNYYINQILIKDFGKDYLTKICQIKLKKNKR